MVYSYQARFHSFCVIIVCKNKGAMFQYTGQIAVSGFHWFYSHDLILLC